GRRSSAANCYLHPIESRANLRLLLNARATRLIVEDGRAVGVEVLRHGRREVARAAREVIIAAGAIGTPKLLMLSGIGPAAELKARGISVLLDRPEVGRNLQDHLDIFLIYKLRAAQGYDRYKSIHRQLWAALQFALYRDGPITSNIVETGAFWPVPTTAPDPDIQFHFLPGAGVESDIPYLPKGLGCTLNAYLVRPKSRGHVALRSPDPAEHPEIDPNFLAAPEDVAAAVESVRLGRRIMRQPALDAALAAEHFPGERIDSDEEIEKFVRAQGRSGYHPSSTCRMGTDGGAVVDTELRLRGVEGARIADASIMPRLTSGNTNATTIMIGERAAAFIRGNQSP
ncbi:MAG: GMC family oxidoreductase, partial [Acetobacteraceae bacterium]